MHKKKNKHRRFVMLERQTLLSPKWKELSHSEMIAYIYIKNNFNGSNNGDIPLKYLELKGILAPETLSKALKGLESKEWIEKTKYGGMFRYYNLYRLTGRHDCIK